MNRKKKIGSGGFRILVIFLAVVLALNVMILLARMSRMTRHYVHERSEFERSLKEEDWPEIRALVNGNRNYDRKTMEDTSDFAYILDYYDAAMQFSAFMEAGNGEAAEKEKAKMESAADLIKEPAHREALIKIDGQLGIR